MEASQDKKSQMERVRQSIFRIKTLSGMPQVVWQLMQVLSDENASVGALAKVIESDPALASKVLSLANSAYYGFSGAITTVERASVIIGLQEMQMLALGAGLADSFDIKKVPPEFDGEAFWVHCWAVSSLAHVLAAAARYPVPGEAMIAGLLHDVGKLVLATHLGELFNQVLEKERQGMPFYQAEEELGVQHELAGFWLAQRWQLPEVYVEAIRQHHDPSPDGPHREITALVCLADVTAKRLGFGLAQQAREVNLKDLLQAVNLDESKFKQAVEQARVDIPPMTDKMLNLMKGAEQ